MKGWANNLPQDVYNRLCDCRTRKSDLKILLETKWNSMAHDCTTKEEVLCDLLDLLECNGMDIDLSKEEYADLLA